MRVLIVHCHPRADSLNAALARAVRESLQAGGHEVEFRDLYAEGFQPLVTDAEHRVHHDVTADRAGIASHAESLRAAEALVLVYPTWWYGLPAMLKGWFDRVWAHGIAFRIGEGAIEPLLTNITRIAVVTTYGSPRWLLWFIGHPDRKVIGRGVRRLCHRRCRLEWVSFTDMDHRSRPELEGFVGRVRRHFARW